MQMANLDNGSNGATITEYGTHPKYDCRRNFSDTVIKQIKEAGIYLSDFVESCKKKAPIVSSVEQLIAEKAILHPNSLIPYETIEKLVMPRTEYIEHFGFDKNSISSLLHSGVKSHEKIVNGINILELRYGASYLQFTDVRDRVSHIPYRKKQLEKFERDNFDVSKKYTEGIDSKVLDFLEELGNDKMNFVNDYINNLLSENGKLRKNLMDMNSTKGLNKTKLTTHELKMHIGYLEIITGDQADIIADYENNSPEVRKKIDDFNKKILALLNALRKKSNMDPTDFL